MAQRDADVLNVPIAERSAFRELFDFGGTLEMLDPKKVSNLDKARDNARALAFEVISKMPASLRCRAGRYPTMNQSVA